MAAKLEHIDLLNVQTTIGRKDSDSSSLRTVRQEEVAFLLKSGRNLGVRIVAIAPRDVTKTRKKKR